MSDPKTPTLVDVTLYLSEGRECRTKLPSDSEILRELFEAFALTITGGDAFTPKLLQVPLAGGHAAYSFSSARLVAIETSPPVVIEVPAATVAAPVHATETARSPRRVGPVVSEVPEAQQVPEAHEVPEHEPDLYEPVAELGPLPFVQVMDFLTPDEQRQLLESTMTTEASFAQSAEVNNRQMSRVLPAEFAERIASRLRLLLPQVLPAYDPSRSVRAGALQLCAQRDGEGSNSKQASDASPDEITCTYFFHREPKPLSGGELRFRGNGELHVVEPHNNAVIIHPTKALHEEMPLRCDSKAFADSRFAVTLRIA